MQPATKKRISELEAGFQLGRWSVAPHTNTIRNPDCQQQRRVSSKAMQVLVTLAASAGQFVSKDALLDSVWRGRVVTEDVLTVAVSSLRREMKDDARNPTIIETRKGAGYRLIADVQPLKPRSRTWLVGGSIAALFAISLAVVTLLAMHDKKGPPVVAVLPFVSLSELPGDVYVANALSDGLIQQLAESRDVQVISRTSILPYDQPRQPLPAIARELGADFVVEGSVLAGQHAMRISAQLIDARDDTHVWSAYYDRTLDDILPLQQEVASSIAGQVAGVVAEPPVSDTEPLTGEALQRLLEARYWLARENPNAVERALTLFDTLSREFPDAGAGHIGRAQALLYLFKKRLRPPDVLESAAASARRALQLEPANATAYRCLGQIVFFHDWDYSRAESLFLRAIALSPDDTVARRRYAWLLVSMQRYDEADAEIDRIQLLDPLYYASAEGAMLLMFAGQYEAAVTELQRVLATEPDSALALRILSLAYWGLGQFDESMTALMASVAAYGQLPNGRNSLITAFQTEGHAGVLRHLLDLGVIDSTVSTAGLHAQLGDHEAALEWLYRAIRQRDPEVRF